MKINDDTEMRKPYLIYVYIKLNPFFCDSTEEEEKNSKKSQLLSHTDRLDCFLEVGKISIEI